MMTGYNIMFFLLAAVTLIFAVLSVTTRQIFRAAVYLLFSLIGIAGIYFWLDYQFVAAVQIVVYAGGIAVLIIFSIFLTQQAGEKLAVPGWKRQLSAALAVFMGFALAMVQLMQYEFVKTEQAVLEPTVMNIGKAMLSIDESGLALPFEVISILLLSAMVGCIVIAMKSETGQIAEQHPAGEDDGINIKNYIETTK